jgi:hypothetical protein
MRQTIAGQVNAELMIQLDYDDTVALKADAQALLAQLQNRARRDTHQVGQTVQIGWMVTRIGQGPNSSTLVLQEPTWGTFPIEFSNGVTRTLRDLRLQKSIVESFPKVGDPVFPSLAESVIVCTELERSGVGIMERVAPVAPDSGWFIGCQDPRHEHSNPKCLRRESLYSAICACEAALPFLALPEGWSIVWKHGKALYRCRGVALEPLRGSFACRFTGAVELGVPVLG